MMPDLWDKVTLGAIAVILLAFVSPWNDYIAWLIESMFGAVTATFFFSPLMAYLLGEKTAIKEKTLFVIGALMYVVLYLILGDVYYFIVYTLRGIALYSFVSAVVFLTYQTLAEKLP